MNDLTSVLTNKAFEISYNETLKNSSNFNFENGTTQTIGTKSVPSLIIDFNCRNISKDVFLEIEKAYQNNHSNTFLCNLTSRVDPRILNYKVNNGVWVFADWNFTLNAQKKNLYDGKFTLVSSVLFNYPEFLNIYNQPSNYIPNISTNKDFLNVLSGRNPYQVNYSYVLNKKTANIGKSISTQRDLTGNKRLWRLSFICNASEWLDLITFYRKKGAIGLFGMPVEGYYLNEKQVLINARFNTDSFKYTQQLGNIYYIDFEVIEVVK